MITTEATEREAREVWAITDSYHVVHTTGYSCAPDNPDYWWVPSASFSGKWGRDIFGTRAEAVQHAIARIHDEMAKLHGALGRLEAQRGQMP